MSFHNQSVFCQAVGRSVFWVTPGSGLRSTWQAVSDRRSLYIYCAASALSITINRRCERALSASARAEARRPDTNTCLSCVPLTIRCKLFTSGWWPNNMFKSLICMRALPHITKSVQIYYKFFKYAIFLTKKFQNHGIYTKYI